MPEQWIEAAAAEIGNMLQKFDAHPLRFADIIQQHYDAVKQSQDKSMPAGCQCDPGEWDEPGPICEQFSGDRQCCEQCEHNRECHGTGKVVPT